MKIKNVMLAVSVAGFCAVVLFVNKAQEMCVAVGQLASEDLTKFTFSLAKPDAANIKQSMVELHATLGTILVISIVMLALVIVVGLIKSKTSNHASEATSEPAPGAGSSSPQG
jgi:hypothetical protein